MKDKTPLKIREGEVWVGMCMRDQCMRDFYCMQTQHLEPYLPFVTTTFMLGQSHGKGKHSVWNLA